MSTNAPTEVESTDLETRDIRALTECMTVLPDGGDVYTVTTESGSEYTVDAREGRCTCPDYKHRNARCKHQRRVAYATGTNAVPAAVDGVDALLGEHTTGTPRVVAADGGMIVADDDAEILTENDDDGRPDECDCGSWNADSDLSCWPCYRAGFDTPASADETDNENDTTPRRSEPADFGHGETTGVQDL